jgi:hypothetical protein
LVVHRGELDARRLAEIEALARDGGMRFQGRFGDDDLYALSVSAASGGSEP